MIAAITIAALVAIPAGVIVLVLGGLGDDQD